MAYNSMYYNELPPPPPPRRIHIRARAEREPLPRNLSPFLEERRGPHRARGFFYFLEAGHRPRGGASAPLNRNPYTE
jgi:hypothetical protein